MPFLRPQPRNFENMTLVARRREHFRGLWALFVIAQISLKRGVLVQKNSLASCQRCRHSVEPRALTCPFKHSDLIAWSLLIGHPTHKHLWGRLCFVHVCCLLSTVTVTPAETRIMSTEALLSKTVPVKIYTKRAHVRSCIPRRSETNMGCLKKIFCLELVRFWCHNTTKLYHYPSWAVISRIWKKFCATSSGLGTG